MCSNPQIIKNKKYVANKTNGGVIPPLKHEREKYLLIDCGRCEQCRRKRASQWQIRITEEIKRNKEKGYFITLTFSDEQFEKLKEEYKKQKIKKNQNNIFRTKSRKQIIEESKYEERIVIFAVRRWLERWRKIHKKSLKHWLIIERGHKGTERVHLHGIIWQDLYEIIPTKDRRGREEKSNDIISKTWKYGFVFTGHKCNNETASYITKYILKYDKKTKTPENFRIMVTPGIGRKYLTTAKIAEIRRTKIDDMPKYDTGASGKKIALPSYYTKKAMTEEQREKRFINFLEKAIYKNKNTEYDFHKKDDIIAFHKIKQDLRKIDRMYNKPYRREIEKKNWKVNIITLNELIKKIGATETRIIQNISENENFENEKGIIWGDNSEAKNRDAVRT